MRQSGLCGARERRERGVAHAARDGGEGTECLQAGM
jgi:hypothetical protein